MERTEGAGPTQTMEDDVKCSQCGSEARPLDYDTAMCCGGCLRRLTEADFADQPGFWEAYAQGRRHGASAVRLQLRAILQSAPLNDFVP